MKPEHRSLLAIVLSIGVLVVWSLFFGPKKPTPPLAEEEAVTAEQVAPLADEKEAPSPASRPSEIKEAAPTGPQDTFDVATPLFDATFTNYGARLSSLSLHGYYQGVEKDSPEVNLIRGEEDQALTLVCRNCNFVIPANASYRVVAKDYPSITYQWQSEDVIVSRRYTVDENRYLIDQDITIINRSERALEGQLGLAWSAMRKPAQQGFLQKMRGPINQGSVVYQLAGSVERVTQGKRATEGVERGVITWAGVEERYFLASMVSRQISEQETVGYEIDGEHIQVALHYPKVIIPPGEKSSAQYSIYVGPKEIDALSAIGVGLEESIDYGWFSFLAVPILYCLKFFESFLGSWGMAIILLTVVVKILLNPLTVKGMRSMKAMQKLQPKLKELREKYGDDKQRINQETMHLFRTHKVNPMGGCLPMVLQMPIYIALYKVFFNSIELFHVPFMMYKDLSAPDPYFVTPILLGIFMLLQQRMTPTASADPMQQKMMYIMPVMFTGFMLFLPLGLVVYILVNTVMTVIQHYMFNHDIRWRDILRGRIRVR